MPPAESHQVAIDATTTTERRGRRWLIISFLACPCHLPLTLGLLAALLGGTALGAVVRDHTVLAGSIVAATWAAGTARGLWLIRQAERGQLACALPAVSARPDPGQETSYPQGYR
jgi:hypothetical protein